MLIVFIGPPGAGKGTQSLRLTKYLQIPHLSTGDMLRQAKEEGTQLGQLAARYIDNGRLVPDPVVVSVVGERLHQPDCQNGCLLDGFPRTLGQAESLDAYLEERGTPLDLVLELSASEDELLRRLVRRAELEEREDDTPEKIARRLSDYRTKTQPLLEYYRRHGLLESVDGMQTPDEVFEDIQKRIKARRI